jgi:acetyl esterase/lipase
MTPKKMLLSKLDGRRREQAISKTSPALASNLLGVNSRERSRAEERQMKSRVMKTACLLLPLLLTSSLAKANGKDNALAGSRGDEIRKGTVSGSQGRHLNADDSIRNLLGHPAFAGFARLLLPSDGLRYDEAMRLSDIGSLLPYHSHVDPETVVGALNRMIDDVNTGHAVFYPFYSEEQKQGQPARENTGLFFFRGKPSAPFAVISPGGGFSYVGSVHEGFPYATEISARGYNAFVLRYRAGYGGAVATEDLAAAISYIFRNAKALGVGTWDYSLWGSSAGARMAAAIGSHGVAAHGGDMLPKPSAIVMAYTAHSDHSSAEPPTFVVVGEQDGIAPPSSMERRIAALRSAGIEVEYHKYKNLGHGFGPGTGTSAEGWIADAVRFWEKFITQRN